MQLQSNETPHYRQDFIRKMHLQWLNKEKRNVHSDLKLKNFSVSTCDWHHFVRIWLWNVNQKFLFLTKLRNLFFLDHCYNRNPAGSSLIDSLSLSLSLSLSVCIDIYGLQSSSLEMTTYFILCSFLFLLVSAIWKDFIKTS